MYIINLESHIYGESKNVTYIIFCYILCVHINMIFRQVYRNICTGLYIINLYSCLFWLPPGLSRKITEYINFWFIQKRRHKYWFMQWSSVLLKYIWCLMYWQQRLFQYLLIGCIIHPIRINCEKSGAIFYYSSLN